jgi:hypothetical protein
MGKHLPKDERLACGEKRSIQEATVPEWIFYAAGAGVPAALHSEGADEVEANDLS